MKRREIDYYYLFHSPTLEIFTSDLTGKEEYPQPYTTVSKKIQDLAIGAAHSLFSRHFLKVSLALGLSPHSWSNILNTQREILWLYVIIL